MTLARFTPSILDADTLERLFVHRHDLLDDVLQRVRGAAAGAERRHRLFIGPRGAGKTHLISLVNHRVQDAIDDGLGVQLSWLIEDPWEIESYDDLLDQILVHLGAPDRDPKVSAESTILAAAKEGPIVTLVENLDQILDAIGDDGQRRLRALLENQRPLLIIATSTRLSDDLLSQAQPFYGFFDTTQLAPFDVDQAADMLAAVAEYNDNPSLGELLHSPTGKARLATIAHLAGGQPRVWALLGTGLTTAGIDDMIEMLLARFDDLTPYYQEQLARLSPNERKLVRRLADADRPLTVRDLAELAKLDQKSVAKTISDLRRRGWVRRYESLLTKKLDQRLQYYELAEPLARIAFQMKASRGEPIRLIVNFLATWFDKVELSEPGHNDASQSYRAAAEEQCTTAVLLVRSLADATGLRDGDDPGMVALLADVDDALAAYVDGSAELLLLQPGAVGGVIEQRLANETPLALRIAIGRLAVRWGGAARWVNRIDELLGSAGEAPLCGLLLAVDIAARQHADQSMIAALIAQMSKTIDQLGQDPEFATAAATTVGFLSVPAPGTALSLAQLIDRSLLPVPGKASLAFYKALVELRLGRDFEPTISAFVEETDALITRTDVPFTLAFAVKHGLALLHAFAENVDIANTILNELRAWTLSEASSSMGWVAVLDGADALVNAIRSDAGLQHLPTSSHADRVPDGLRLDERAEP